MIFSLVGTGLFAQPKSEERIQWFSTLEDGLKEAKRTQRPILFLTAAPSCAGVSGIW